MKKARARNVRPQAVQQPGRHAGQVHRGDLGHQGGAGGAGQIIFFFYSGKSERKYAKFVFVRRTAAPSAAARFSRLRRWSQPP